MALAKSELVLGGPSRRPPTGSHFSVVGVHRDLQRTGVTFPPGPLESTPVDGACLTVRDFPSMFHARTGRESSTIERMRTTFRRELTSSAGPRIHRQRPART